MIYLKNGGIKMLKFKKIIGIALVTTLMGATLISCSKKEKEEDKTTLTIGVMSSIDAVPMFIAKEKDYYKKEGVNVDIQVFKNSKDRDAALQAGTLDGVICDEVAVNLYQNANFDVKITGATDGNFVLIAGAKSNIKSYGDLKGKSVAISEKTCMEYTLDKLLEKNSIDISAVNKTAVPAIPTRYEMLKEGKIDAALLPEPFSTLALNDGGVKLGSAVDANIFSSVSAFTQKAIDSKSKEIKNFYKAYNDAVKYINSTPISEYEKTVIDTVGYPKEMAGKIVLPKYRENVLPDNKDLETVIKWVEDKGLSKKNLKPSDLVSDVGIK